MALPNYRVTVAIGTGKEGEDLMALCNAICKNLDLRNVRGEPNYSALFRRAIESLAKEVGVERGTA